MRRCIVVNHDEDAALAGSRPQNADLKIWHDDRPSAVWAVDQRHGGAKNRAWHLCRIHAAAGSVQCRHHRLALLPLFWEECAADNEIGRAQSMNAALNRIRLSLDGKGSSKSSVR